MKHLFFIMILLALSIGMAGADFSLLTEQEKGNNHEG